MHTVDHPRPSRQRGPHNDASMLDGDSAHGNPGEPAGDEWAVDTDTDVVDQGAEDELDDAVADPVPETEDEVDEFEAGAEPEGTRIVPPVAERELDEEVQGADGEEYEAVVAQEAAVAALEDPPELPLRADNALEAELERPTAPNPALLTPPIDGYDALTIPQVLAQAKGLDVGQLNAVLEYERANRNRKTLVAKLTRMTTA